MTLSNRMVLVTQNVLLLSYKLMGSNACNGVTRNFERYLNVSWYFPGVKFFQLQLGVTLMGVMLQAFFWDCPRVDKKEFQWWTYVRQQIPSLANAGFTSLWLPPVHKAANLAGPSMGYDPYDYYDLGEFDQKGSIPT